jgi:hypothetical protein
MTVTGDGDCDYTTLHLTFTRLNPRSRVYSCLKSRQSARCNVGGEDGNAKVGPVRANLELSGSRKA